MVVSRNFVTRESALFLSHDCCSHIVTKKKACCQLAASMTCSHCLLTLSALCPVGRRSAQTVAELCEAKRQSLHT